MLIFFHIQNKNYSVQNSLINEPIGKYIFYSWFLVKVTHTTFGYKTTGAHFATKWDPAGNQQSLDYTLQTQMDEEMDNFFL